MSNKTMKSFRLSKRAIDQLDTLTQDNGDRGTRTDFVEAGIAILSYVCGSGDWFCEDAGIHSSNGLGGLIKIINVGDLPAMLEGLSLAARGDLPGKFDTGKIPTDKGGGRNEQL